MNAPWLLIGLIVGAAVTVLALRARLRALNEEAVKAGELQR